MSSVEIGRGGEVGWSEHSERRCVAAPGTCVHCRLNCSTRHPLFVSYSPLLPPLETHLVSHFLDVQRPSTRLKSSNTNFRFEICGSAPCKMARILKDPLSPRTKCMKHFVDLDVPRDKHWTLRVKTTISELLMSGISVSLPALRYPDPTAPGTGRNVLMPQLRQGSSPWLRP